MKKAFAALTILAVAMTASAAIEVQVDYTSDSGFQIAKLTLVGTAGEVIQAVDFKFAGDMNQVWELGVLATPTINGALGDADPLDTHLLLPSTALLVGQTLTEDGPGTGSSFTGAFGISGDSGLATSSVEFAQIVIPGTSLVDWYLEISDSAGAATKAGNPVAFDIPGGATPEGYQPLGVPEPATMSLLGVGVLALIRRRK